jgi:predicted secreted protein
MGDKVRGIDIYVCVNTGTHASPVWTKVGGQKDATRNMNRTKIDVTDKDSGGWEQSIAGNRSLDIDFDAFLIEDDAGMLALEAGGFWGNGLLGVECQLVTPLHAYSGYFQLTKEPMKATEKDAATVSFTLASNGAITMV